jgi:hypothetical protein
MVAVKESQHFYPVLFYFRFPKAAHPVSRWRRRYQAALRRLREAGIEQWRMSMRARKSM